MWSGDGYHSTFFQKYEPILPNILHFYEDKIKGKLQFYEDKTRFLGLTDKILFAFLPFFQFSITFVNQK